MRVNNEAGLERYVQNIANPASVNYHRFLNAGQFTAVFAPRTGQYAAVRQYLEAAGFTITHTYKHHLLIAFRGSIGQVEQVFHVTINSYTTDDGKNFYANANDPLLPASIVASVLSLSGLNNATQWQRPPKLAHTAMPQHTPPHTSGCPGHGTGYVTPDQTAAAYNLNGLYNAHYAGEGQTVALFELDTFVLGDLQHYASCYGQSHTTIQTIVSGSGRVAADNGMMEVELDAELILSAAPHLGMLKIYEAANDTADYNAEWAQIIQDAPPVVSTSWGNCEKAVGAQEIAQENTYFTVAAAQGQSIFAASGDSGSTGCAFNQPPNYTLSAGDPGSQPFVTSVGGTSLKFNGANYGSETTWNNMYGASGGGISQYWSAPAWQNAPGVKTSWSQTTLCHAQAGSICRETPDVSLYADPTNGYLVYCSARAASCSSSGAWYSVGGTSAAAPLWAAFMAITNEMAVRSGGFNIGFANPLLYQIASNSSLYAVSFHDVTGGNNDYTHHDNGSYPATANYDMATGLGSYNGYELATRLVTLLHNATGLRASPTSTLWYFAEGSVGGGFQEYLTLQNPSASQNATVNITYLFESRPAVTITHSVPASTRATVSVNTDLHIAVNDAHASLAAIVRVVSGPGIVAERPMYFTFLGTIKSGTDVLGTTQPATTYYFAEADTRQVGRNYYTFVSILNPSTTQAATTTLTFYTGTCSQPGQPACLTQTMVTPPLHRGTSSPPFQSPGQTMAIQVNSDIPVVVERPMYVRDTLPTIAGVTTGAASEVGATSPGNDWLFAEGYTGPGFQQYFVLANFGTSDSHANIHLEYTNGHTQTANVTVPALGQTYVDVNQLNAHPTGTCDTTPCKVTSSAAAEITADAPIVADRLMYFKQGRASFSGCTETVGEVGPATHTVYAFAEGYTGGAFAEFLTLQNPMNGDETVVITMLADGFVMQEQVLVKAHSRQTLYINAIINPIVNGNPPPAGLGANDVAITAQVLGTGTRIVAERPMYFGYGSDQGGTDVIGYAE